MLILNSAIVFFDYFAGTNGHKKNTECIACQIQKYVNVIQIGKNRIYVYSSILCMQWKIHFFVKIFTSFEFHVIIEFCIVLLDYLVGINN